MHRTQACKIRLLEGKYPMSVDTAQVGSGKLIPISHPQAEADSDNPMPDPPAIDEEYESMDSTNSADREPVLPMPEFIEPTYPVIVPAYFSPFFPFSFPFWPGYTAAVVPKRNHEVVKPLVVHSKSPINVDELVGMSKLSLGESHAQLGPSSLSVKSLDDSTRQSAFHANPVTDNTSHFDILTGLRMSIDAFFLTMLIVFLSIVAAQGLELAIGAILMDVKRVTTLASVTAMTFILAGGFFVKVITQFDRETQIREKKI